MNFNHLVYQGVVLVKPQVKIFYINSQFTYITHLFFPIAFIFLHDIKWGGGGTPIPHVKPPLLSNVYKIYISY